MKRVKSSHALKKEKEQWKKERLQSIKLLLESEKWYAEVASIVGKHPSRIKEWAKVFRNDGLTGLLTRGNGGGRKPKMTKEIELQLVEKLRSGTFRTAGQILPLAKGRSSTWVWEG